METVQNIIFNILETKISGKLNYEYINKQGRKISVLADDFETIANINNLFNHTIDKKVEKKIDELMDIRI